MLCKFVLAKNKEITYHLLGAGKYSFPAGSLFPKYLFISSKCSGFEYEIPRRFQEIKREKSIGIHTNILSFQELAKVVTDSDGSFIVQEMVFGKEYRHTHIQRPSPRSVGIGSASEYVGNGMDTIATLIERKNINLQKKIIHQRESDQTLEKNNFRWRLSQKKTFAYHSRRIHVLRKAVHR